MKENSGNGGGEFGNNWERRIVRIGKKSSRESGKGEFGEGGRGKADRGKTFPEKSILLNEQEISK